jgi:precorrin-2 dehydrogenase/sirohydrochlorin ferrochelatase
MGYLVNLTIKGRPAVVVGGGSVASRKVRDLLDCGGDVTVVASTVCPEIQELAAAGRVRLFLHLYSSDDLCGAFVAVAATDDEEVNARISREAQAAGVLVNVVDRPALCTFTLPAVVRRGDLTIAIATEGRCPALASILREELGETFGPEFAEAVRVFGEIRRQMIAQGWNSGRVREAVRRLYKAGLVDKIKQGDRAGLAALIRTHLGSSFPVPPDAAGS